LEEANALLKRVRRLLALERITPADAAYLEDRLDEIRARIVSMREMNERGEEEG
jgi:hypothetical protein